MNNFFVLPRKNYITTRATFNSSWNLVPYVYCVMSLPLKALNDGYWVVDVGIEGLQHFLRCDMFLTGRGSRCACLLQEAFQGRVGEGTASWGKPRLPQCRGSPSPAQVLRGASICWGFSFDTFPIYKGSSGKFRESPHCVFPVLLCWSWHVLSFELQPGLVTFLPHNRPHSADAQPEAAGNGGERVSGAKASKIIRKRKR